MPTPDPRRLATMTGYDPLSNWRNQLVCKICNWLLNNVATATYADIIEGAIILGIDRAAEQLRSEETA
jgi:hypothetical protein